MTNTVTASDLKLHADLANQAYAIDEGSENRNIVQLEIGAPQKEKKLKVK